MTRIALALSLALPSVAAFAQSWPTLPDHQLTPGKARNISLTTICDTKWGSDARAVTSKMKEDVIAAYDFNVNKCPFTVFKGQRQHRVEIDHLIPRSLGGADVEENLWPECYEPVNANKSLQADGAHKKGRLETELHRRVCDGGTTAMLKQYHQAIKRNWISLYHKTYGDE
jgi:5-methylcytosine-specific restriction endonuclease McrA